MKYGIIGAGISGLSIAQQLRKNNQVVVFEKDSRPGGMIKCDVVNGCLFHRTGGHVFNTKRKDVFNWFGTFFDKENEFTETLRKSVVCMDRKQIVPYPIENHVYLFDDNTVKMFIEDLVDIVRRDNSELPSNFEDFLQSRFGKTLYELYFKPYNYKVWRRNLSTIPLDWLDGKLPMPTVQEIICNNMNHVEEHSFVHSSFFYPRNNGSQFLADRLSQNLDIIYNVAIERIEKKRNKWEVNGVECDRIIYCGNIKDLPSILNGQIDIASFEQPIVNLESHGTTSVFCEMEHNPYSWIYLPSQEYESHRIICTGNFADSNRDDNRMTGTIEFTDYISKDDIIDNLNRMPFGPKYWVHNYEKYTYPIQGSTTRKMIQRLKSKLEEENIYLLGRFAEWEYYNMDVAMGAAMDLSFRLDRI